MGKKNSPPPPILLINFFFRMTYRVLRDESDRSFRSLAPFSVSASSDCRRGRGQVGGGCGPASGTHGSWGLKPCKFKKHFSIHGVLTPMAAEDLTSLPINGANEAARACILRCMLIDLDHFDPSTSVTHKDTPRLRAYLVGMLGNGVWSEWQVDELPPGPA